MIGVVQYQMVSPENIYASNILQMEQVIFRNIYVDTYIHVVTINGKEVTNLKEGKKALEGGKEREKCNIIISKIK